MNQTRRLWREPMIWMLVGLPLASVAIGFSLLFAAVHPGREDREMADKQIQVGRMLVSARSAVEVSTQGLVLRTKGDMIEALPMDGNFPRGGKLTLTLTSPHAPGGNRSYQLVPSELGWRGLGSLEGSDDWAVQLTPDNAVWLLRGHWPSQARFIHLKP
ncbi:FixH family protein [Dyella sp. Tek66A03]|uniref:FixH family protein n=1 Tax=Dyella sp. Tek66A03 TaxID=3458298 RepID=UPI00403EADCD